MDLLPEEVCRLIVKKLTLVTRIRLGAVSRFFRRLTKEHEEEDEEKEAPLFPWLMFAPKALQDTTQKSVSLQDGFATLRFDFGETPAITGAGTSAKIHCCGCSQDGWLVLQSMIQVGKNYETTQLLLINPLSNATIELPRLHKSLRPLPVPLQKIILSSDPCTTTTNNHDHDPCIVAAIDEGGEVYFSKLGDSVWASIGEFAPDIVLYKGQFIGYDEVEEQLLAFEYDHLDRQVNATRSPVRRPRSVSNVHSLYLVESHGELLMVLKGAHPQCFEVYTLCWTWPTSFWAWEADLGDGILFVGYNASKSASAKDFPAMNLKGNCIYFADGKHCLYNSRPSGIKGKGYCVCTRCTKFGVYHLKDRRTEPLFPDEPHLRRAIRPPLMWFTPNPPTQKSPKSKNCL